MARPSPLMSWVQYAALRGVGSLMHAFPPRQNLWTAAAVGSLYWRCNQTRRARAEGNIARSFPDWPRERVADVAEQSMQHMFQLFMVDSLAVPRLVTPDAWPRYVRLGNLGPVLERLVRGEPMIMITGHCGNWELFAQFLALLGYPLVALARPIDNPLINAWLTKIREARGTRIVTKWGATPIIQETLRRGGRVGFIADQNAGDQGLFVPFFGRLASSYKSIGLLAIRHGVPIVAGHARRITSASSHGDGDGDGGGGLRYELSVTDVIEPADWKDQPDPLFYVTARYNRAMEQMVRNAPEQYLWLHRRWKSRPRHERDGRPMPERLVEKLRSLPWMSEEELARLRLGGS
jgi:Kdo2-lipid IVA lauroyltransferase/acyltransferase